MKPPTLLIAVCLLISLACGHADEGKHLFILSGQSNMVGLKEKMSFTPVVEKKFGKDHVIVVKDAAGGQPIRQWYKAWKPAAGAAPAEGANGKLYDRLMSKVNPAIEGQKFASVTFVWMQGERDAKEKHGEVYADSFKGLLAQLKADLKCDDINFVIGRLSDFDMQDKKYPHWTIVRDAQVKLAESDPLGTWVDTDAMNGKSNGLHYSKEGYAQLGKRFAEESIRLVKLPKNRK